MDWATIIENANKDDILVVLQGYALYVQDELDNLKLAKAITWSIEHNFFPARIRTLDEFTFEWRRGECEFRVDKYDIPPAIFQLLKGKQRLTIDNWRAYLNRFSAYCDLWEAFLNSPS